MDLLRQRTIKGIGWSAIDNITYFSITFVVGIILARLLSPEDFGLLGITTIFSAVCNAIVNGGFSLALIRIKEERVEDYNTAFFLNLLISIFLYLLLFVCSPIIANFFNRQELVLVIRITSLGIIISAIALIQRVRLVKHINFQVQAKITLFSSFLSGFVGIVMALLGYGVWSLVAQNLINVSCQTFFLWVDNMWIPSLKFSILSFKRLFGYSWKIMFSSLINTIWGEMTQVIVGKYYSPTILGQYTRSQQFNHLLSGNITGIIQRVTFPVLSSIQNEEDRILNAYRKITKITIFITAVSLFFVGSISVPLLYCLIGPKWHLAAVYLPMICIAGSVFPLISLSQNMILVKGRSDTMLVLTILHKIICAFPLIIGVYIGIIPMLISNIFALVLTYFLYSFSFNRIIGYSIQMQIRDICPSYYLGVIIATSVYFLKYLPLSYWLILPIQMIIGAFLFFSICEYTRIEEYTELKSIILSYIKKKY